MQSTGYSFGHTCTITFSTAHDVYYWCKHVLAKKVGLFRLLENHSTQAKIDGPV